MGILELIFVGEIGIICVLFGIVIILLAIWSLLKKIVVVPGVTVSTDKTSYTHGETVTISGKTMENGIPVPGKTVSLELEDPSGAVVSLGTFTTSSSGDYSTTWAIPSDAIPGSFTVYASGSGVTATTTFTLGEP